MAKQSKKKSSSFKVKEFVIRRSPFMMGLKLFTAFSVYAFILVFIFIFSILVAPNSLEAIVQVYLSPIYIGIVVLAVGTALYATLRWQYEYYIVRKDNIHHVRGILYRREKDYACNNIESMTIRQNILGRIFGYGTIEMYDPALKRKIILYNINNPQKYKKIFEKIFMNEDPSKSRFIIGG